MSQQLLRDPEISPSDAVLKNEFGNSLFGVYQDLIQRVSTLGLQTEWRYYRDGKGWLCKITRKQKLFAGSRRGKDICKSVFILQKKIVKKSWHWISTLQMQ